MFEFFSGGSGSDLFGGVVEVVDEGEVSFESGAEDGFFFDLEEVEEVHDLVGVVLEHFEDFFDGFFFEEDFLAGDVDMEELDDADQKLVLHVEGDDFLFGGPGRRYLIYERNVIF